MELDESIKTALVQIVSGIREAQSVDGVGAFVVPSGDGNHKYPENSRVTSNSNIKSTIIDFDVATTVENVDKTGGGGGLKVAGIGADLKGETANKDVKVSRVQFGVPIMLPESQSN